MAANRNQSGGFTLVELMVTIAVLAILVSLALPSFRDFAERSSLRGVADNVVQLIGTARTEAIKRDALVRVDFRQVGTGFCLGAATVSTVTAAGCNCSSATCAIADYPSNANELESIALVGTPAFGSDTAFVVDPKTGMLADVTDVGSIELSSPGGYGVKVAVNAMGRSSLCTPGGKKSLSGVDPCP
jgi:type IV fimbrial biogenesis protein FimT